MTGDPNAHLSPEALGRISAEIEREQAKRDLKKLQRELDESWERERLARSWIGQLRSFVENPYRARQVELVLADCRRRGVRA